MANNMVVEPSPHHPKVIGLSSGAIAGTSSFQNQSLSLATAAGIGREKMPVKNWRANSKHDYTVVGPSPHHPEVKGLSPPSTAGTSSSQSQGF